jgi:subtilisin family serine protease
MGENPGKPRNTKPLQKNAGEVQGIVEQNDVTSSRAEQENTPERRSNAEPLIVAPPKVEHSRQWLGRLSTPKGMYILTSISAFLVIVAIVGAFYVFRDSSEITRKPRLTPPASLSDLVTEFPELASILNDVRLDSVYKDFLVVYQKGGANTAYELAKKRGLFNTQDELVLTLELDGTEPDSLVVELENHGINVNAVSGNLIDVAIPLELIQKSIDSDNPGGIFSDITNLNHVIRIRMSIPTMEDVGLVDSESLPVIGAIEWQEAGFTGKGIKVGILDKGFNYYKDLLGTDLPDEVVAKSFYEGYEPDNGTTEHGSAVAEIVHDVAPDAELYFAPYGSETEMEQAVDWLLSQDVDIIQNSTGAVYGPFDGTSFKAKLVDRTVESGVLWVNSAGNAAKSHYRGVFTDNNGDGWHEFAPGEDLLGFTPPSGSIIIVLNWDDWDIGEQDFDLYIYDENWNEIASSRNTQDGPDSDSAEGMIYEFPDSGTYYAAFYAVNATRPVVFDFFVWDGELEYQTPQYSVTTPGDALGSLTVGAVYWENDVLEDYSSQGPTQDGRLKPELVAPSMVNSAAYGKPWPGTSASAPHVSGAAALILQAFPDFSPQEVAEFLENRAVDLGNEGPDNIYGYGRLWLGDPPGTTSFIPTEETRQPMPEETATLSSGKITTPTPKQHPTETPPSSEGSTFKVALGLLICTVLPGMLGLGGIGLLAGVLYGKRMHTAEYTSPLTPTGEYTDFLESSQGKKIGSHIERESFCPRCGNTHRVQAQFCNVCGYMFKSESPPVVETKYCISCGQALRQDSKFCSKCGKPTKTWLK